jgi:hypothetical protein
MIGCKTNKHKSSGSQEKIKTGKWSDSKKPISGRQYSYLHVLKIKLLCPNMSIHLI